MHGGSPIRVKCKLAASQNGNSDRVQRHAMGATYGVRAALTPMLASLRARNPRYASHTAPRARTTAATVPMLPDIEHSPFFSFIVRLLKITSCLRVGGNGARVSTVILMISSEKHRSEAIAEYPLLCV